MIDFLRVESGQPGDLPRKPGAVLFVFPHPDDDVFVGGTLSLLVRAGVRVEAAWMTSGGYDGLQAMREQEMEQAMDVASVERRHLLRLPDGGLVGALDDACAMLYRLIGEVRPRAVIGPAFRAGTPTMMRRASPWPRDVAGPDGTYRYSRSLLRPRCRCSEGAAALCLPLAHAAGVRRVDLDEAATRCKASMAAAYASQKSVFDLLGWRPSCQEQFRECPRDRDHRLPCAGLNSYAHWFNWRSCDRFEQLVAAVTSATARQAYLHTNQGQ